MGDPDTDPNTLADRLDHHAEPFEDTAKKLGGLGQGHAAAAADLRAAADGLRQLAAITAAIGDPDELRGWVEEYNGIMLRNVVAHIADAARAASLSPTPTPDHCPSNCANGWVQVQYDSGEWSRELEPCPDPWHDGGNQ